MNAWALTFVILFIVAVLFLSISMYWTVKWPNWQTAPYDALPGVVSELGPPTTSNYAKNGMAVWNSSVLTNQPWKRVIVRDEAIPHCCPTPHTDFLYTSMCLDIPNALVESMVLSISETIWYDSLKKRLWIRCNSLRANVATALMVVELLSTDGSFGKFSSFNDLYDYYWNNSDEIQAQYAALLDTVTTATDDVYNGYKSQLQAKLELLGCPDLAECDDSDCSTPWDGTSMQATMKEVGVDSIPPPSVDPDVENYRTIGTCGATNGCQPRNRTAREYSLGPRKNPPGSKNTNQPNTLGYPVDKNLPFNALDLTRERYSPEILADTRQELEGGKVGVARNQNSINGRTNHNISLVREIRAGPQHHKNIEYAVALHNNSVDTIEGWANDMTSGECKSCSVKRNGRPMTISAV